METRRRIRHQGAKQHRQTVERIVFGCKCGRGFRAVPVKGRCHQRLGKISVREPVCPLPLSLESACNRVLSERFLMPSHVIQLRVAEQNIPHDHRHARNEIPIRLRRNHLGIGHDFRQGRSRIAVVALAAVFPDPCAGFFIFPVIIDFQFHAAQNFHHGNPFRTDTEVFLQQIGIAKAPHDAHRYAADIDI